MPSEVVSVGRQSTDIQLVLAAAFEPSASTTVHGGLPQDRTRRCRDVVGVGDRPVCVVKHRCLTTTDGDGNAA